MAGEQEKSPERSRSSSVDRLEEKILLRKQNILAYRSHIAGHCSTMCQCFGLVFVLVVVCLTMITMTVISGKNPSTLNIISDFLKTNSSIADKSHLIQNKPEDKINNNL